MRLVFLSDIHGNLEALEAVRDSVHGEEADGIYCLGDVVGYGADPEACWRIVAEEGWETLLGNHDAAVLDPAGLTLMNPVARAALQWTRENVSEEGIKWLESLVGEITVFDGVVASHALPILPESWLYSDDPRRVMETFKTRSESIIIVGHLHFAHAWQYTEEGNQLEVMKIPEKLELGNLKWILNVGSVGQPRDGDHRACYVVLDVEEGIAEYKRVQYDTVTAARKIVDAGLPEVLAQRLFMGQ